MPEPPPDQPVGPVSTSPAGPGVVDNLAMSYYFVVNCSITDPAMLGEYLQAAGASAGLVPMKILAMDDHCATVEGTPAGSRTVLLEFESEADFRTWYDSPEYQAAIGKRLAATDGFAVGVNGFDAG